MNEEAALRAAILSIISLLVRHEYLAVANITGARQLSAQMLEFAVTDYGRTLTMPPNNGLPPDLEILDVAHQGGRWHAVMSLWTEEEGESDLGLELTLISNRLGLLDIEIDGIHVL